MSTLVENPLVSIICTTYNHERYIRQALEGFLAQKCNFSFEIVIHDDASTDRTADIIREYRDKSPSIFNVILQTENQYSQGNDVTDLLYNQKSRGKYIALCEGDDYWIDPFKLQKQVDFLEEHEEYGLVYGKSILFLQMDNRFDKEYGADTVDFEALLAGKIIPTLTVMMRKDLVIQYCNEIELASKQWLVGDLPMFLWFAENSKIHFQSGIQAVYRILQNSASHVTNSASRLIFFKSLYDVHFFFAEKYRSNNTILHNMIYYNYVVNIFRESCIRNDKNILLIIQRERMLMKLPSSRRKCLMKITILFPPLLFILHNYTKIRGIK